MFDYFATDDDVKSLVRKSERQAGEIARRPMNAKLVIMRHQYPVFLKHWQIPSRHVKSAAHHFQGGGNHAAKRADFQNPDWPPGKMAVGQAGNIMQGSLIGGAQRLPISGGFKP